MITFDSMSNERKPELKSSNGEFGGGFVRNGGKDRPVRVKVDPVSKMAFPEPTLAQEALLAAEGSMTFPARQHPLKSRQTALNAGEGTVRKDRPRKTKLACLGIPSSILDEGDPAYSRCVRLANAYKKARTKEFFNAHGYVSSGASALLAAAALALSASRFLYEIAASTPIRATDGGMSMPQILKLASSLSDSARQNELSAWELCAREGVVRKRNEMNTGMMPWLSAADKAGDLRSGPSGEVKRGPGRPRKLVLAEENNNAGTINLGTSSSSSQGSGPESDDEGLGNT